MIDPKDRELLIRDKYDGDSEADMAFDLARLSSGEPLAYVIGWVPFLGLKVALPSRPLIPRPETEWWTEELIAHLKERFGDSSFGLLDLCAGSGVIGLSVLSAFPHATVTFAELVPEHLESIRRSLAANGLDESRATLVTGNLFEGIAERFAVIATNPPYIPEERVLERSVTEHEPAEALFSGLDGLSLVRRIAKDAPRYLKPEGELWLEADIENIEEARDLLLAGGAASAEIRNDLYGRPRIVVGYYA
ncbi:MAG TPA: peptide chain release factor N(5)-glutamine methyltransferase [Candidatus Paceibacterota bacterium]|nr:peptide chain release factor N(5)-glutamine methyltransferase [Candidatus Paceibacterota bacterium]